MKENRTPRNEKDEKSDENVEVLNQKFVDIDTKVPPDGGWGWMVVLAFGVANVSIQKFIFSFFM